MSYLSRVSRSLRAVLLSYFLSPLVLQAGPLVYTPSYPHFNILDLATASIETFPQAFSGGCIAVTPDGTMAYVGMSYGDESGSLVFPVNLVMKTVGVPISVNNTPFSIAITPDGSMAYVSCNYDSGNGEVVPITLATNIAGTPIEVSDASTIAITPDGSMAYVGSYAVGTITSINLATGDVGTPINVVGDSYYINAITISPDGTTAYVGSVGVDGGGMVTPVTLAIPHVEDPIYSASEESKVTTVAITPDGSTVYVGVDDMTIVPITVATHNIGTPIDVRHTPYSLAISPDGTTACIADQEGSTAQINLITGSFVQDWATGQGQARGNCIAFAPDQAPIALFTKSVRNLTASFDGSGSSSLVGSIATYDWDFGDGQNESSSSPTTTHTYSTPGTFTVTLTVTNTSGTSMKQVFTGQTVSKNGGPSAERSELVIVGPPNPSREFVGRVHKNNHKHKLYLKTSWKKSSSPGVAEYQIFSQNKKVKTISAQYSPKACIRLYRHHHVSKSYRKHLSEKYRIRAVGVNQAASPFTQLRVIP